MLWRFFKSCVSPLSQSCTLELFPGIGTLDFDSFIGGWLHLLGSPLRKICIRPYVVEAFQILHFPYFPKKMSFSGDRTLRCFDFSWFSSIFKFFAEWLGSPFQKILIRPYALEVFQILRFPYVPQSCHFQLFSGVGTLRCLDFTWFS